jgi:hypothetical protein
MKKLLTAAAILLLVLVLACAAQETCKRHAEPEGGFSYCPPEGWEALEYPGLKFKTMHGTYSADLTPNMNVVEASSPLPLKGFVSSAVEHYSANAKNLGAAYIKKLSQSEFTTLSGWRGFKVAFQSENRGLLVRTTQYYFGEKGDGKLVVTFTCLEKESNVLDRMFDHSTKTLRIDK